MESDKVILVGHDSLGNPIIEGCIFEWCRFPLGPFHKHSLILLEDRLAASVAMCKK